MHFKHKRRLAFMLANLRLLLYKINCSAVARSANFK